MLNNLKLRQKFIFYFVLIGIVPLSAVAIFTSINASIMATKEVHSKLEALKSVKKAQIEDYFKFIDGQVRTLSVSAMTRQATNEFIQAVDEISNSDSFKVNTAGLKERYTYQKDNTDGATSDDYNAWTSIDATAKKMQTMYIFDNKHEIGAKEKLDTSGGASYYDLLHEKYHPAYREYLEQFGYYDIFLVGAEEGRIIYSVFKEVDYGTSLFKGPYAKTGIAKVAKQAIESGKINTSVIDDFESYDPSYGAQAAFTAAPVLAEGSDEVIGALVFQMPVGKINEIMATRVGMGETGETYLVGSDGRLRSDSPLSKEAILGTPVESKAIDAVKGGVEGMADIKDYRGKNVLSSFGPLTLKGLNWGIVAEVETAEVNQPIYNMLTITVGIALAFAALAAGAGVWVAEKIVKPILVLVTEFDRLSNYDLRGQVAVLSQDEIGDMSSKFNTLTGRLGKIIGSVRDAVSHISAASEELSSNAVNMREMGNEQGKSLEQISAAIEESSATIYEINQLSESSAHNVKLVEEEVQQADVLMKKLSENAEKIVTVTTVIEDIADQTNLLALNAAIEAARAGDAGRGFAVVADEVRKLAASTNTSTQEIGTMIQELRTNVEQTGGALGTISGSVGEITSEIGKVSQALEQQSAATEQISATVNEFSGQVQHMINGVAHNSEAAADVAKEATSLDSQVDAFKVK